MTTDSILDVIDVIDVQEVFVNDRSRHVVSSVATLLDKRQATNKPLIFTRFHNQPGCPYETIIGWTRLRTPEETAIAPELQPYTTRP